MRISNVAASMGTRSSGDEIADAVISTFNGLPAPCKPQYRGNGNQEWVPLSGIAISQGKICAHHVFKCS